MMEQEFVLCTWKKRLWPAKVLRNAGAAGTTSVTSTEEPSLEVEILGLEEQVQVQRADVELLKEEHIENIVSGLDQRPDSSEAVEELKYRRSLKIALDILTQNGLVGQEAPSEGPNALSQESSAGSLSRTPSHRCRLLFKEPEMSKKREQKNNCSLKTGTNPLSQEDSLPLGESARARRSGENPWKCGTGDVGNAADSGSQNCRGPESKPLPRQKKTKPRLSTKSGPGNRVSRKRREGRGKQERKRPRAAGLAVPCGSDSPKDRAQPLAGGRSPPPVPCGSGTAGPVRRAKTRSQAARTVLDPLCESASEDLEKSISSESDSLAKQLDGRKKPGSLKRINGEHKPGADASSSGKRKCRRGASPSRLEPTDLSSKIVSSESLSRLSALLEEEEEEDEELPSILSPQEPQVIEDGNLVWCKLRGYPYWPAMVKKVKRKHRKACVLLIDGTTSEKKKGFSVPLKSLKHFDCEEKQELIERAKEDYRQEIEWCIRLISDYRIRLGCHSFTGSFLEYFAADISYPVRKEGYQGSAQMTFPEEAEEGQEESPSETSPPKPRRKLLPDRSRAARDRANKKIVEFIVKMKGAEEHLLAILKSRKQSRWLKEFLKSSQYMTCVETYLEDEEQLDLVVNYLKEVYHGIDAKNLHQIGGDGIKLISDVLLPEAIIYAIAAVDDIDYEKAEEKYIKGPSVSKREREIFEEEILERKKRQRQLAAA
ncbi:PWWP domain-containing protein MUM1, partial [Buceros rhinoceros silvestris]